MAVDKFLLDKTNTALLIIDTQERLAAVMKQREQVVRNILHLVELMKMQGIPVVVTEQYPKGLGRTVPEIRESLAEHVVVEKVSFNCCEEETFNENVRALKRKKILVTGMEAHICVLQTGLGLLAAGYDVHLVNDAVCSRTEENRRTGVEFLRDAGATVTCTETALFQLLGVAGSPEFRTISQRIR